MREDSPLSPLHLRLLVFAMVSVYTVGFLLWYSSTALGLAPMLDGREQLELASHIADGSLPVEPYYRAPLFPALVAWLIKAGIGLQHLPFATRALNGALHLLGTGLVAMIAWRVWRSRGAAALAALLFGMHPVVLYFAADPLDLTLAMTLMLGGVLATLRAFDSASPSHVALVCAALLLTSAMLARPQMLMLLPPLLCYVAMHDGRRRLWPWALLPMLLVAALMGLANLKVGGAFRVLPWQGAYNLWAANGPEANGRYFVQREREAVYGEGGNPARIESERRYRREQPGTPDDYATMSNYWQRRTLAYLRAEPVRWLQLVASKAWYLLNDFEQYDITTYHFHKARSPWLRWNPLGWSGLLAAAMAALVMHGRRREAWRIVGFAVSYAVGLLLSYVSARFRLPLVPLLAVLAGGMVCATTRTAALCAVLVASLVLLVSAQPLPAGEANRTIVQDYLLTARAASVLGFDDEALDNARGALALAPDDVAARELMCVAAFNAWLRAGRYDAAGPDAVCAASAATSPAAQRALGVLYWRAGRVAQAQAMWRSLLATPGETHDAALAALLMSGAETPATASLDWRQAPHWTEELLFALALHGEDRARQLLVQRVAPARIAQGQAALAKLFAPPP